MRKCTYYIYVLNAYIFLMLKIILAVYFWMEARKFERFMWVIETTTEWKNLAEEVDPVLLIYLVYYLFYLTVRNVAHN
jgi:hypothetical protein